MTNFHLPKSSLLMLVAAFAGRELTLEAYRDAVARALPVLQLRRCDVDSMTRVKFGYDEFDLSDVRTYPLASRESKVRVADFARPWDPATGFEGWLASLPTPAGVRRSLARWLTPCMPHMPPPGASSGDSGPT